MTAVSITFLITEQSNKMVPTGDGTTELMEILLDYICTTIPSFTTSAITEIYQSLSDIEWCSYGVCIHHISEILCESDNELRKHLVFVAVQKSHTTCSAILSAMAIITTYDEDKGVKIGKNFTCCLLSN